jgi:hypothetical protein
MKNPRVIQRNLIVTCFAIAAAVACAFLNQKEVALALVTFVGGLWIHSGRERAAILLLVGLGLGCDRSAGPDASGYLVELGLRAAAPARALPALGTLTDRVELKPHAAPSCTAGNACLYALNTDGLLYTKDANELILKLHAAQQFRTSSNCAGLASPVNGDVCYDTSIPAFRFYSSGWTTVPLNDALLVHLAGTETITGAKTFSAAPVLAAGLTASGATSNDLSGSTGTFKTSTGAVTIGPGTVTISGTLGAALAFGGFKGTGVGTPSASGDIATKGYVDAAAPEIWFTRTCTITSAAAATPVNCLADAAVPAAAKVYLMGFHAYVNGATPWATTATCAIGDTVSVTYATVAVAAMTANAYITDTTANVTLGDAFQRNLGGTTAKGVQISCNANGTGSDFVVTVFGTMK